MMKMFLKYIFWGGKEDVFFNYYNDIQFEKIF